MFSNRGVLKILETLNVSAILKSCGSSFPNWGAVKKLDPITLQFISFKENLKKIRLVMMYKIIDNLAPTYRKILLTENETSNRYNIRFRPVLKIPSKSR